jgi:hypothetical protein
VREELSGGIYNVAQIIKSLSVMLK